MTEEKGTKKQELLRALKFVLFSISAGVIQILTFTLLNEVIGFSWWPSHLISLALSVIWNFTFNRKFTFKSAVNVPKAMLVAFLFYVPFTPATVFGGQALVNIGWNEYLVEGLTMLLNFVLEYFYSKYVTFRNNIDTANIPADKKEQEDAINSPSSTQVDVVDNNIQNETKQDNISDINFVFCEYCGTSQFSNKEKCSSCGAPLRK